MSKKNNCCCFYFRKWKGGDAKINRWSSWNLDKRGNMGEQIQFEGRSVKKQHFFYMNIGWSLLSALQFKNIIYKTQWMTSIYEINRIVLPHSAAAPTYRVSECFQWANELVRIKLTTRPTVSCFFSLSQFSLIHSRKLSGGSNPSSL